MLNKNISTLMEAQVCDLELKQGFKFHHRHLLKKVEGEDEVSLWVRGVVYIRFEFYIRRGDMLMEPTYEDFEWREAVLKVGENEALYDALDSSITDIDGLINDLDGDYKIDIRDDIKDEILNSVSYTGGMSKIMEAAQVFNGFEFDSRDL